MGVSVEAAAVGADFGASAESSVEEAPAGSPLALAAVPLLVEPAAEALEAAGDDVVDAASDVVVDAASDVDPSA